MPEFIPKARSFEGLASQVLDTRSQRVNPLETLAEQIGNVGGAYFKAKKERKDKETAAAAKKKEGQEARTGELMTYSGVELTKEGYELAQKGEPVPAEHIKKVVPMSERLAGSGSPKLAPVPSDLAKRVYAVTGVYPKTQQQAELSLSGLKPKDDKTKSEIAALQGAIFGTKEVEEIQTEQVYKAAEEERQDELGRKFREEAIIEADKLGVEPSKLPKEVKDRISAKISGKTPEVGKQPTAGGAGTPPPSPKVGDLAPLVAEARTMPEFTAKSWATFYAKLKEKHGEEKAKAIYNQLSGKP